MTWGSANITAFQAEGELRAWLTSKGYAAGAVVSPQTAYDLGRDWYATRLDLDFEPLSPEQAQATFAEHGLVGEFWSLTS